MATGCLALLALFGVGLLGPLAVGALLFVGLLTPVAAPIGMPPPPIVSTAPAMQTPIFTPIPAGTGANFAPITQTIWNAEPGKDRTEGTCGEVLVNYCAHMVAITRQGEDLLYKGMEIQPYTLKMISADRYAYSGRNMLDDGSIEMTLTFTSAIAYTLDQVLVLDADPECRHINTFSGTFMR